MDFDDEYARSLSDEMLDLSKVELGEILVHDSPSEDSSAASASEDEDLVFPLRERLLQTSATIESPTRAAVSRPPISLDFDGNVFGSSLLLQATKFKTNHALREKVSPKDTVADQLSSSQRSDHASKLPTPLMTGENDINYVFSKNLDDGVVEIEAPQHYDELTALLTFRDDDSLWCFEILWSSLNTVEH